MPAGVIREMAHAFATAPRAMICWTLGITEHHNAVDNVLALINLALLTGHVGRWGSGINPLRGQNNVQGGGDMGALPDRLPGFQHVENDEVRAEVRSRLGRGGAADARLAPDRHVRGDGARRPHGALRHRRESRAVGGRPAPLRERARVALEVLVVQDVMRTATAELADVVLPAAAGAFESEGTVTSSERRVQRVRRAKAPVGESRDDLAIIVDLARRMGATWPATDAEGIWNELRHAVAACTAGMSYARLDREGGLQWPCYDEAHPGEAFLHGRLWERPVARSARAVLGGRARAAGRGRRRRLSVPAHDRAPPRGLQHRRADRRRTRRRCAAARPSTCRRRTPGVSASARGSRCACGRGGAVSWRRCTSTRRCGPA